MASPADVKPELVERVAVALETVDRRMATMENDISESSGFSELLSENVEKLLERVENIAASVEKLAALQLAESERYDRIEAMVGNYVEATKDLRQTTVKLHSEVREKLKAL